MVTVRPLRLAIVGCGAIAEQGHLPGAALARGIEVTALVDRNRKRAELLAERFHVPRVLDSVAGLSKFADCAVIATPPGSHCSLTVNLSQQGIHVLVEKPVAPSTVDCDVMIAASERNGTVLAVGMVRRFYPTDVYIKDLLGAGILGSVGSFCFEDGYPFNWPMASNFILSKEEAGGGVLMGLGSHILDTVIWWFGDPDSCKCHTDAMGGMESECLLELGFANGIHGIVELSRSRQLKNQYSICCQKGTIEAPFYSRDVRLTISGVDSVLQGSVQSAGCGIAEEWSSGHAMTVQLEDFAAAIREESRVRATGVDVRRSIRIIEECYSTSRLLPAPWRQPIGVPA